MTLRELSTWEEVGRRVATARRAAKLTQDELAVAIGLDRTAISKIEAGRRNITSIELVSLARELRRPLEWFVSLPPSSVLSRRSEVGQEVDSAPSMEKDDGVIESMARDVELLVELETLSPNSFSRPSFTIRDQDTAESAARLARAELGQEDGPLIDLIRNIESFGLFCFSTPLSDGLDGMYVSLQTGGVAVVNGASAAGRRRFTLAHEFGHHYIDDEYATDHKVGDNEKGKERLIDVFAIHLLMPRTSIIARWHELRASNDVRDALIRLAVEYRVSWTAVTTHAKNLRLIDNQVRERLNANPPTRMDLMEGGLTIAEELLPPAVSPSFAAGVVKAYRRFLITDERAIELLRGTASEDDLPTPNRIPIDRLRHDLTPLS